MKKKPSVSVLEKRIRKERHAYYAGEPNIPDSVFNALMDKLRAAAPNSPVLTEIGAKLPGSTGKHSIPMGSLDEAKTFDDMRAWMAGIEGGFLVTDKVDGLSLSLDYKNGELTQALTRGTGITGEDVTANVRRMMNVKKRIPDFTGTLRGEAFMPLVVFKAKYEEDYANPRNLAAGIVRRHSGEGAEDIALRYFYVKRSEGLAGPAFKYRPAMLTFIRVKLGLLTVMSKEVQDIDSFANLWYRIVDKRHNLPYEIDGVVVYITKASERNEGDPFFPDNAIVFKFEPDVGQTTVTRIENRAGRSGRINPRVHVRPVKVGGVTITHATGNNYPWLRNLSVGVGAQVEVSRCGDTIPAIERVIKKGKNLIIPKACPVCNGPLAFEKIVVKKIEVDGAYLKCGNILCAAKDSGAVAHWLKLIEVKGVGKETLAKLVDLGMRRPYELYEQDVDAFWVEYFGRNGLKVHKQLMEKKVVRPELVLAAHVPNVGRRRFRAILDANFSLEQLLAESLDGLVVVDGIGTGIAIIVAAGVAREADNIRALLRHVNVENPKKKSTKKSELTLKGWAVKFTGTMSKKRAELEEIAEERGARIGYKAGYMNVLVLADPDSQSGKAKAARKAGHKLISETEFMEHAGL